MKRGGPLRRNTPLAQGDKGLARGKPLARGKGLDRVKPMDRTGGRVARRTTPVTRTAVATPDPVTPATRAAVRARSGGRCEAGVARGCAGVGQHVHHRQLRRFGDHRPINLLHVCHVCHDAIHRNVAWSYAHGFLVRSYDDPEKILPRVA